MAQTIFETPLPAKFLEARNELIVKAFNDYREECAAVSGHVEPSFWDIMRNKDA